MKECNLDFKTVDGKKYKFNVYPKNTSFRDIVAIYAFLKHDATGWYVLYIGQSTELGTRIANHNKWLEVNRLGCTHIGVCSKISLLSLDEVEKALIEFYRPRCNERLVP